MTDDRYKSKRGGKQAREKQKLLAQFTERAINKAAPGDVLTERGSRGLRLTVHATGRKSWIYRFSEGRKLKQATIGYWPTMTIAQARAKWEEDRITRASGGIPHSVRRRRKHSPESTGAVQAGTVRDVCEKYLTEHLEPRRTKKSVYDVRGLFGRYVYPKIGERPASGFSVPDAAVFIAEVAARTVSSARILKQELGAAWGRALRLGRISGGNPWPDSTEKGELAQGRASRFLDDSELRQWLRWLPASRFSPDVRDALRLTLFTAARPGEIVAVKWSALDLDAGTLKLRMGKTARGETEQPSEAAKGRRKAAKKALERIVHLPRQALEIIQRRRRDVPVGEEWVFPSPIPKRHIRQHALVWSIANFGADSGLEPWSAHDLRRTARTGFARLGIAHEVGEAALGHVRGGIAGVYDLHKYEREVGKALERWADHLDTLTTERNVVSLAGGARHK